MARSGSRKSEAPLRGVEELPEVLGERRFRARIPRGKGGQVNLGVYPDRWKAAFAYNVAVELLHGPRRPSNEIPGVRQPGAEEVRRTTARVRRRLGLEGPAAFPEDRPPSVDRLRTFFEITVVGFWRGQVASHEGEWRRDLDVAARRLVEAAHLLFWSQSAGHPTALEVLEELLALRLDRTFRRSGVTRGVLDDDGDDELRLARWLVLPESLPGGGGGFAEAIRRLYAEVDGLASSWPEGARPSWASILGVDPPFDLEQVRSAYRSRSKAAHPDAGGSPEEFVRLQAAYEEALRYCRSGQG